MKIDEARCLRLTEKRIAGDQQTAFFDLDSWEHWGECAHRQVRDYEGTVKGAAVIGETTVFVECELRKEAGGKRFHVHLFRWRGDKETLFHAVAPLYGGPAAWAHIGAMAVAMVRFERLSR